MNNLMTPALYYKYFYIKMFAKLNENNDSTHRSWIEKIRSTLVSLGLYSHLLRMTDRAHETLLI